MFPLGVFNASGKEGESCPIDGNDLSVMAGSPPPDDDDDNRAKYENTGTHDPSGRGQNAYNKTKSVLPENHQDLWRNSRAGPDGNGWTKVGEGKKRVSQVSE